MKNKLLKSICLALVILTMTSSQMISCSDNSDSDSGTDTSSSSVTSEQTTGSESLESDESAETSALSKVPVNDYGGYEFKIISTNQNDRQVDFIAEELNGQTLNDLVYERNMAIEEMYNIKITAVGEDFGVINNMITQNVAAGDSPYDLYMSNATAYSNASAGHLLPLNTVSSMDLSAPYWDQAAYRDMSIGGNIYMMTGDISPQGLLTSECLLFNKRLFDDSGIEYPYQDALDGTWTLDKLKEISSGLTRDLNGDGEIKVADDLYSLTCWFDYSHALYYGAGGHMISKDENDIPYLDWDLEKQTNIYQKIYDVVIGNNAHFSTVDHELSFEVFNEGRAYFCGIIFQKIETFLRDMEDDFGVLPLPKYDESQENYVTDVSGAVSMVVLPVTTKDIDRTGNIIDALAAASYDMITPDLINVIASTKNVRDKESSEITKMIIRNRTFDMGHMYYIKGDDFVLDLLKQESTDVASYMEKNRKLATKTLESLVEDFIANNK